jgi:hypothetical protein
LEVDMPVARASDVSRSSARGVVAAACVAVLVPALAVTTAGAAPRAQVVRPGAAAVLPAGEVRQPTVREVALAGVDRSVLSLAPAPHADEPAKGQLGQMSAPVRTKPAVAATLSIRTPAELVAVSADQSFPIGTTIQVRVQDAAGWSAWSELHVDPEHGPAPGSSEARRARFGSDPLLAQDARRVQVRIDTPDGRLPKGTGLTLVDAPSASSVAPAGTISQSGTSVRGAFVQQAAMVSQSTSVGQPAIITRAQWGADESWRSRAPYYTSDLRAGFIHHTASTSSYTREQAAAQVRAIYAYHTRSLGHSDIDYNFVVDRFGRLYEGRFGGIDRPVLGAHTAGFNEHTFAVVALGNFSTFNPPVADMAVIKDSIARLFAWKLGLHGVNPTSTAQLVSAGYIRATKYPKGSVASISATSSHQTVNYTACPGTSLQAQLPSIRALAGKYSRVVVSAPSPTNHRTTAGASAPVRWTSAADRAVRWTADILSPCSETPVRTFRGTTAGAAALSVSWDLRDSSGSTVLPATYTLRMTGTAVDGTPVAPVTSTVTVAPVPGGAWGPCADVHRVAGDTAAATSVLWGRRGAPAGRVVVLTGTGASGSAAWATGLSAAPLARSLGAPLLQTAGTSLADEVAADLRARAATEVLIVGGADIVSDSVASSIAALGPKVSRIAGASPAATAAAVAARMPASTDAVLVSPADSPAHALAGAALAVGRGAPLLLSEGSTIPPATTAALAGRRSVTAVTSAVPEEALARAVVAPSTWVRLAASDAVGAGLKAADAFPGSPAAVTLLPDAPATWQAGPMTVASGSPVLFSGGSSLSDAVASFLQSRPAIRSVVSPVSSAVLTDEVLGSVSRALRGQAPAVATSTRRLGRTDASPEPVVRGGTVKARATVTAQFTDGSWRPAPAGIAFTLQFKATGATSYKVLARGVTTVGQAASSARAPGPGAWRIVVGGKASASDYVAVRR